MSQNPIFSPIIKPLGPLVSALNAARNILYRPPQSQITGINQDLWPNPLQPVQPMGPVGGEPLSWQFEWGRNLIFTPRDDAEYSFAELRKLATYPLARVCIENNKDIITRMPCRIQLKPKSGETSKERAQRGKHDKNLLYLNNFLDRPNPREGWSDFIRPILDDMLVIDAASVFIARDGGGRVKELWGVDGGSITRLVEEHGLTPLPPNPAYQQLWQGYPRVDLTSDQLLYRPRNIVRRNTQSSNLYGFSPTEQLAKEIMIGMQRLQFIYDFYKEGSIPGAIQFVPPGVSPDKIKEAQQYLDATYAGNLAARRRLQLVQGWQEDGHPEQLHFPKEPVLADVFDELHTRRICFAYGTSPQRLMRQMNKASAAAAQESAEKEGTLPWMTWLKGFMDDIIQRILGFPDYEFAFDPVQELDKLKQSQADKIDAETGLYTMNEIRERRGDDPRPEPEADVLNVRTTMGFIPLGSVAQTGGTNSGNQRIGKPPAPAAAQSTNKKGVSISCEKHHGSYPRSYCQDCIASEVLRTQVVYASLESK